MVGYNASEQYQLSEFWHGFAGISSGVIARLICQPLDVLKIRFQLQHEPLIKSSENYYWGLKQASSRIIKEESLQALWKGHIPAQVLSGVYGLAQFLSFEVLTKLAYGNGGTEINKTVLHFLCGSVSGGVATVVSMPFDTVRTRLVGQGEPKIYKGVTQAFLIMIRTEGYLSLYKGMTPNLIQIVPHTGMQFGMFNVFSEIYRKSTQTEASQKLPVFGNILCGSAAGFVAKIVVYPLDLAKKRLQVQGFEKAREKFSRIIIYKGMTDCLRRTAVEEGFSGLYKGLVPSCVKAMAATGLVFALYEEIIDLIRSL